MKLQKFVRHIGVILVVLASALPGISAAGAQTEKPKTNSLAAQSSDELGELQLAAARTNPLQLRQFLKKMPKGADLHYHLSGGVYAELMLQNALDDGMCVDVPKLTLTKCAPHGEEKKELM